MDKLAIAVIFFMISSCTGGSKMAETIEIQIASTLNQEDFFSITEKDRIQLLFEKIPQFNGIVIAGPLSIALEKKAELPILAAIGCTSKRNMAIHRNLTAVCMNANGASFIGPAKHQTKIPFHGTSSPEVGADNSDQDAEAYSSVLEKYDLRKSLNIPWQAGEYRITFLYYDWISNTIETRLFEDGDTSNVVQLPCAPPERSDAYVPIIPGKKDMKNVLSFSLPETVACGAEQINLKGSINLAVSPKCISENAEKGIVALKPLILLLLRKNQDHRPVLQIPLAIAGNMGNESGGEKNFRFAGDFDIDLAKIRGDYFSDEEIYCCYLASYEVIAGPVMLRVVKK